ncbi:PHB depolymerase family esterase [Actinoplanes sichuanensis]|uniref:Alpha/beta hydrolase family esterase n=1 Tax=Actinoplanes sichuanensis TaxID=512349 RepID=A0ABW4ADC0_9ACTN|nr:PHB depolymerase family esterase [Actinoplanes sichuanensis]BEL12672.1 PHB depolymerase family esterase [Actinoplanes sichuanensis]
MSRLLPVALALLLLLPAGCTRDDDPIEPGSTEHTLGERTFRTYRPASLPDRRAVPLVVVLHGGAGSGAQAERAYGWNAAADRDGFVVAYPDGTGRSWNAGPGCCGPATRDGVDDVRFLEDVVAAVARGAPIDPTRVRVTGMSNGAMMAYRLACDSTVFTAIAPVAGMIIGDCPHPAPVPVLHIHGTDDASVPWAGGPGKRSNGGTGRVPIGIDGPPIPDMIADWRSAASCAAPTETVDGPVTTSIATCPGGRTVELISITGAGHQWPGATPADPVVTERLGLDPPSTALDATAVIAKFFTAPG